MGWMVKNIGKGYAWILKTRLGPGEMLDLEETFKGFCIPKKSSRAMVPKFSEFKEGEFDEFMEWIRDEIVVDASQFQIINSSVRSKESSDLSHLKKRRSLAKAEKAIEESTIHDEVDQLKEKRVTYKNVGKKLPSQKDMTPKEIAWLPFDDVSKKIISDVNDVKRLKMAFKLVRNIAGQERTRKLIEDRLSELAADGR
jgi:hypothetical protein